MYQTAKELAEACARLQKTVAEVVYEEECERQNLPSGDVSVRAQLSDYLKVMKNAAERCLTEVVPSVSGLSGGDAKRLYDYLLAGETVCGSEFLLSVAYALSTSEVNASMGLIVASPTAGASGILPGALLGVAKRRNITDVRLLTDALLVAAGIGQIIEANATLSGAEGGCQAECGSAAAMAAGAVTFLCGGTTQQIFDAAAMALKNVLGLVCDPIAGLVECPCIKRNASGAANALLSADLALAGIRSIVPFDEVVEAMARIGSSIAPELRETALGGLAKTPTGKEIKRKLFEKKQDPFEGEGEIK